MSTDVHDHPDVDALYELDPGEFVAARDALAKEVRADDRSAAAEIKKLRRPTTAAWAVNRAVRARPQDAERLLELGRALRSGGVGSLREAMAERRALIAALADAAVDVAGEAHRAEIEPTVEAASVDEALADAFRRGHLERAAEPGSGLDALLSMAPPSRDGDGEDRDERAQAEEAAAARRAELRRRLDDAEQAVEQAGQRVEAAQTALDDARGDLRRAEEARDRLAADLDAT